MGLRLKSIALSGIAALVMSCGHTIHDTYRKKGWHDIDKDGRKETYVIPKDFNHDGVPDEWYQSSYDLAGNKIEEKWDAQADGAAEMVWRWEYDRNNMKKVERVWRINDAENRSWKKVFDSSGNVTAEYIDNDGDGRFDQVTLRRFDEVDRKIVEAYNCDGGRWDRIERWDYTGSELKTRAIYEDEQLVRYWTPSEGWVDKDTKTTVTEVEIGD